MGVKKGPFLRSSSILLSACLFLFPFSTVDFKDTSWKSVVKSFGIKMADRCAKRMGKTKEKLTTAIFYRPLNPFFGLFKKIFVEKWV